MDSHFSSLSANTKISRRSFLKGAAAGISSLSLMNLLGTDLLGTTGKMLRRPNIIFMITDDQSTQTMGSWGGKALTPHQDSLARDGISFTRAYCTTPMCTASRYTCLTGRYAGRCSADYYNSINPAGEPDRVCNKPVELEYDRINLPKVLQKSGYKTGMTGKWHLGQWIYGSRNKATGEWVYPDNWHDMGLRPYPKDADPGSPAVNDAVQYNHEIFRKWVCKNGFDYANGVYWGNPLELQNDTLSKYHNLEWITKAALDFIDESKEQPFFLYYSTTLHHYPNPQKTLLADDAEKYCGAGVLDRPITDIMPSRKSIFDRVKNAGLDESSAYCTWLDDGIGAILKKVDDLGLAEDTIIIQYGDNGYYGKASLYEIGVHVPMMVRWKGHITPGTKCNKLVSNIDFAPTIMEYARAEKPDDMHLDGMSISPLLAQKIGTDWRKELFLEFGWSRAICTDQYKYIAVRYPERINRQLESGELKSPPLLGINKSLGKLMSRRKKTYFDRDQLYDLKSEPMNIHFSEPAENINLAENPDYKEIVKDMQSRMKEYFKSYPNKVFGEFSIKKETDHVAAASAGQAHAGLLSFRAARMRSS